MSQLVYASIWRWPIIISTYKTTKLKGLFSGNGFPQICTLSTYLGIQEKTINKPNINPPIFQWMYCSNMRPFSWSNYQKKYCFDKKERHCKVQKVTIQNMDGYIYIIFTSNDIHHMHNTRSIKQAILGISFSDCFQRNNHKTLLLKSYENQINFISNGATFLKIIILVF